MLRPYDCRGRLWESKRSKSDRVDKDQGRVEQNQSKMEVEVQDHDNEDTDQVTVLKMSI